jgi:Predicted Rossmann fold nucleotide-binding protein
VGIVTGMDNARNNINILSSDVVIACGYGGSGTASEIALALKSGKPVILLNERRECIDFFRAIGGKLVHESNSVDDTISHVKKLLGKAAVSPRDVRFTPESGHKSRFLQL